MDFRNIAIIAHVDHGKTTLVDGLLSQCKVFAAHETQVDRVMDSGDLERERGITITSKNTAVNYGGVKVNIMDTPGHADFGGEVERVLQMCEGALLLVDASEGPLPQTRFVLRKAMDQGLKIMVCVNKIDRPDARADEVLQEVYDLFIDLDANDDQLDFPVLYACAKEGYAQVELEGPQGTDLRPLLDAIIEHIPAPVQDGDGENGQMLITNLDYDPYVGRLALGRLRGAPLKKGQQARWFGEDAEKNFRVQYVYTWNGLKRTEVNEALPGDVVAIVGHEDITVGDTVAIGPDPAALPRLRVDEPTIGMTVSINTSPLSGRDGKFLTGRQIRERVDRELLTNVSLRLEENDTAEAFKLFGRGELQLAILIEQMRREGYEFTVGRPEVRFIEKEGQTHEPYEELTLDVPDFAVGELTQILASRKGQMTDLVQDGSGRAKMVYRIPTRGLIGFRGRFLTETRGEGIMNTLFDGWDSHAGFIQGRQNGSLIADRKGPTTAYALYHLQPRGTLFVGPQTEVYEGMVIGEHARGNDLNVNVCKGKQLTNVRSAGADEKLILAPPRQITLETALDYIDDDECVEITPAHIRIRKTVLASNMRTIVRGEKGAAKKAKGR